MPEFNVTTVNVETASLNDPAENTSVIDKTSQQSAPSIDDHESLQRQQSDPVPIAQSGGSAESKWSIQTV